MPDNALKVILNSTELKIIEKINQIYGDGKNDLKELLINHKKINTFPYGLFYPNIDPTSFHNKSLNSIHKLNALELDICNCLGAMRTTAARKAGMVDMLVDHFSKTALQEKTGIIGELLVGRIFDIYPSETFCIKPRKAKDDEGDYVIDGLVVDAKATTLPHGNLIIAEWKRKPKREIDIYILLTQWNRQCENIFCYRGCSPKFEAINDKRKELLKPNSYRYTYKTYQKELITFEAAKSKIDTFNQHYAK